VYLFAISKEPHLPSPIKAPKCKWCDEQRKEHTGWHRMIAWQLQGNTSMIKERKSCFDKWITGLHHIFQHSRTSGFIKCIDISVNLIRAAVLRLEKCSHLCKGWISQQLEATDLLQIDPLDSAAVVYCLRRSSLHGSSSPQ